MSTPEERREQCQKAFDAIDDEKFSAIVIVVDRTDGCQEDFPVPAMMEDLLSKDKICVKCFAEFLRHIAENVEERAMKAVWDRLTPEQQKEFRKKF